MTLANDILFQYKGDTYEPIQRHKTGLTSFDLALRKSETECGMPLGTGYEVFGAKSTGKSTFCRSLSAILGKQLQLNIVDADLEGSDPGHGQNILRFHGYDGIIRLIHQGTDEEILEHLENAMLGRLDKDDTDYSIGILDSIAAISPVAERDGDLGQANMGRRAFLMAQFTRRLLPTVHPRTIGSKKVYFMTNHWYSQIGTKGYQSPGGNVKDYLFGIQIHLKRRYVTVNGKSSRSYPDGSYILEGTIYKNRYGRDREEFQVFVKGGAGIHPGITAVIDAQEMGIVNKAGHVKIGDQSFGYLSQIIKNEWENDEFFQPFYDALKEYEND